MTDERVHNHDDVTIRNVAGLISGLGVCSVSLSTGFIWACGLQCDLQPIIWTPVRQPWLVLLAAFTAWWGYLFAHLATAGHFIDASSHDHEEAPRSGGIVPDSRARQIGVVAGVVVLIVGMVVGVVYIRQGNHLLTNVGGALFLGGYTIAHYAETDTFL